ncbi:MAG: DUF4160 domain-containing protein [Oscillospiraceae bacterium]|jgi:hypothetical protein|nr:DUF4160 domain-containing protein [Oscillospiraceae bacterium]
MPSISNFYGILIYIYQEKNSNHKKPHIHALYGEYELTVDFEANILAGEMPRKQKKLIEAWVLLHQDELKATWKAYTEFGELLKIKGLE